MGFVLLVLLSLLAWVAAVAAAERLYPEGVSEKMLASLVLALAIVLLPVHVLGWTHVLYRGSLALASAATSLAVLGLAWGVGGSFVARARRTLVAMREIAQAPAGALVEAWKERSIVFPALVVCYGILAWTAWLSWLAPSGCWDGLTYHEPIAYYAIQNHGFGLVDVASDPSAQQINSAPRLGHCLMLWLVVFTDRRLVELAPTLMSLVLLAGFYTTARRHTGRLEAMGWSVALLLVPAIVLQMRSTLQDASFAAVFVAAAAYMTRPTLRPRDALMAALALGFMGGIKATGLLLVPLYGLMVVARIAWICVRGGRRWIWAATAAAGLVVVCFWMAPTYVRNWVEFENPVWPRSFEFKSLGIEMKGPYNPYQRKDLATTVKGLFDQPAAGKQYHDTRDNGYGNAAPFIVLPLAIAALVLILVRVLIGLLRIRGPAPASTVLLLLLALPALVALRLSPSWGWARYNVYAIAVAFALAVWLVGRRGALNQALMGAMIVMGCVTLWWSEPGWAVSVKEALRLAREDAATRAASRLPGNFSMQRSMALLRAAEIGEGDLVVYTEDLYIGVLWNEEIDSRVRHLAWKGSKDGFLGELERLDPEWVQVRRGGPQDRALASRPSAWEPLGPAIHEKTPVLIYRRRGRPGGS